MTCSHPKERIRYHVIRDVATEAEKKKGKMHVSVMVGMCSDCGEPTAEKRMRNEPKVADGWLWGGWAHHHRMLEEDAYRAWMEAAR